MHFESKLGGSSSAQDHFINLYIVVVQIFWQPSHFHFGHQLFVLNWRGQNDTVDQKGNELMAKMKFLH